jgi:hypothetical protein
VAICRISEPSAGADPSDGGPSPRPRIASRAKASRWAA